MSNEFDIRWERRRHAGQERGAIDDARWHDMVAFACAQQLPEVPISGAGKSTRRLWSSMMPVMAACMAFAIAATTIIHVTSSQTAGLHRVGYRGQEVSFLCNNSCDANRMISSLDEYLNRI